ncbi:glutathione S-transferase family protein [Lichenifustis flavocetrariae]|uniref:Glutathione S-transferase family protein n=1 Tax=Lichenifustis flavocetrariae TaxID=2949735 RepID=A0AA41YTM6_9HYPH|nr:glutathione S-transferase family protein [Lichenifustis flavocetrariae]MCW6506802.1 glutathione S-transferase family protein [Lichenifustis flavocetrariae]
MLIDGKWVGDWKPSDGPGRDGSFARAASTFRNWITPDGEAGPTGLGGFKAEPDRYHLYVALICPWASRTLMVRKLKKLDRLISVSVVEPALTDQGWRFGETSGADHDALNGATYMHEIYTRAEPAMNGRATVPVLWDKQRQTIVNNESADIVRMLNTAFATLAEPSIDLNPADLATQIDAFNKRIYDTLNNGVYRAGFAQSQRAYEDACRQVFETLDAVDRDLGETGFVMGERFTESDIRLFVTLIRFDAAYHGLFKCNIRTVASYAKLAAYLKRVLDVEGVRDTVNLDHIKRGYYSIKALNPPGIVPLGPDLGWLSL